MSSVLVVEVEAEAGIEAGIEVNHFVDSEMTEETLKVE